MKKMYTDIESCPSIHPSSTLLDTAYQSSAPSNSAFRPTQKSKPFKLNQNPHHPKTNQYQQHPQYQLQHHHNLQKKLEQRRPPSAMSCLTELFQSACQFEKHTSQPGHSLAKNYTCCSTFGIDENASIQPNISQLHWQSFSSSITKNTTSSAFISSTTNTTLFSWSNSCNTAQSTAISSTLLSTSSATSASSAASAICMRAARRAGIDDAKLRREMSMVRVRHPRSTSTTERHSLPIGPADLPNPSSSSSSLCPACASNAPHQTAQSSHPSSFSLSHYQSTAIISSSCASSFCSSCSVNYAGQSAGPTLHASFSTPVAPSSKLHPATSSSSSSSSSSQYHLLPKRFCHSLHVRKTVFDFQLQKPIPVRCSIGAAIGTDFARALIDQVIDETTAGTANQINQGNQMMSNNSNSSSSSSTPYSHAHCNHQCPHHHSHHRLHHCHQQHSYSHKLTAHPSSTLSSTTAAVGAVANAASTLNQSVNHHHNNKIISNHQFTSALSHPTPSMSAASDSTNTTPTSCSSNCVMASSSSTPAQTHRIHDSQYSQHSVDLEYPHLFLLSSSSSSQQSLPPPPRMMHQLTEEDDDLSASSMLSSRAVRSSLFCERTSRSAFSPTKSSCHVASSLAISSTPIGCLATVQTQQHKKRRHYFDDDDNKNDVMDADVDETETDCTSCRSGGQTSQQRHNNHAPPPLGNISNNTTSDYSYSACSNDSSSEHSSSPFNAPHIPSTAPAGLGVGVGMGTTTVSLCPAESSSSCCTCSCACPAIQQQQQQQQQQLLQQRMQSGAAQPVNSATATSGSGFGMRTVLEGGVVGGGGTSASAAGWAAGISSKRISVRTASSSSGFRDAPLDMITDRELITAAATENQINCLSSDSSEGGDSLLTEEEEEDEMEQDEMKEHKLVRCVGGKRRIRRRIRISGAPEAEEEEEESANQAGMHSMRCRSQPSKLHALAPKRRHSHYMRLHQLQHHHHQRSASNCTANCSNPFGGQHWINNRLHNRINSSLAGCESGAPAVFFFEAANDHRNYLIGSSSSCAATASASGSTSTSVATIIASVSAAHSQAQSHAHTHNHYHYQQQQQQQQQNQPIDAQQMELTESDSNTQTLTRAGTAGGAALPHYSSADLLSSHSPPPNSSPSSMNCWPIEIASEAAVHLSHQPPFPDLDIEQIEQN